MGKGLLVVPLDDHGASLYAHGPGSGEHPERGTNLREVQALLGHQSLNTTAVYTHLAKTWLDEVKSPLDSLKEKDSQPKA